MFKKGMATPGSYNILPDFISRVIAPEKKSNEETRLTVKGHIDVLLEKASKARNCEKPAFALQEYTRRSDRQRMAVFEIDERAKKMFGMAVTRIEMPFPSGENSQNPVYPHQNYPESIWWIIQAEVAKALAPFISLK